MPPTTKTDANQSFFITVLDTNTGRVKRIAIPADVQVGLFDNPAFLALMGGFSIATTRFLVNGQTNSKINVDNNNTVISVDLKTAPPSNSISVILPSTPCEGQLHVIKDASGTAGSTPISISPRSGVKIDGEDTQTIDFAYGSLMLYWSTDAWHILSAATGGSTGGTGGADASASYIVIANTSSLSNERALAVGPGLSLSDGGAGGALTINLNSVPDAGASYITIANTSSLSNERSLVVSSDLKLTDAGANSTVTVGLSDINSFKMTQIPDVSASYVVVGVTSSLPNERALTAGANVTITDNGPGNNIVISAFSPNAQYHDTTYSPVALYQLSGNLSDSSGRGNTLTVASGTIQYAELANGLMGAYFTGASGLVTSGTVAEHLITGSLTIELLAKIRRADTNQVLINSNGPEGDDFGHKNYLYMIFVWPNGELSYFAEHDLGINIQYDSPAKVPFDELFHLAMTRDGINGNVKFYINDRLVASSSGLVLPNTGSDGASTTRFQIGYAAGLTGFDDLGSSQSVSGTMIASVKLLNVELTQNQIVNEFSRTLGPLYDHFYLNGYNRIRTTSSFAVDGSGGFANDYGDDVFFFVSGTTGLFNTGSAKRAVFGGDLVVSGGLSGTLQTLVGGASYLVAGEGISIVSQSNGQVAITSTNWQTSGSNLRTTSSVAIDAAGNFVSSYGTDIFFYVSGTSGITGSQAKRSVFGGDLVVSGGISGSIQRLANNLSYLVAGSNVVVTSQSNGQIIISSTATSSGSLGGLSRINYLDTTYNPVALYKFSGSLTDTGLFANVITASGASAETYNVPMQRLGEVLALQFNGNTAFVTTAALPTVMQLTGSSTFQMLIRCVPSGSNQVLLNLGGTTGDTSSTDDNFIFQGFLTPQGLLGYFAEFGNNGTNIPTAGAFQSTSSISWNQWIHIAWVNQLSGSSQVSGTTTFYINGANAGVTPVHQMPTRVTTLATSSIRLMIGGAPDTVAGGGFSRPVQGATLAGGTQVASVKILSGALTSAEIQSEFYNSLNGLYF